MTAYRARLTELDIRRLIKAADDDERAAAAHKLCRNIDRAELDEAGRAAAHKILRMLAEDAAEQVDEATGEGDDAAPFAGSPFGEESHLGSEPPEGYAVKANSRTRKYRVPGSSGYERAAADVWFTSAEAAEAAGFVKAQR